MIAYAGDDGHESGHHEGGEQHHEDRVAQRELQSRERVGGEAVEDQVPGDDAGGHDDAVEVVLPERCCLPRLGEKFSQCQDVGKIEVLV